MTVWKALAFADVLDDGAGGGVGGVDDEGFDGFVADAVDGADDDAGAGDGEFVAFAPHGLDEDGEVQDAASGDFEGAFADFFVGEGDVAPGYAVEAVADVPGGEVFAGGAESGGVGGDAQGIVHGEGIMRPGFGQSAGSAGKGEFSNDWKKSFQWLENLRHYFQ